jgi:arginine decarboxylase
MKHFSFYIPKYFSLVAGKAEGNTKLTAFDNALLSANVGDYNIVKVSSIIPPGCVFMSDYKIEPGSIVYCAYAFIICNLPGEIISSAIAVGVPNDYEIESGLIMEYSSKCIKTVSEKKVKSMVVEGMTYRKKDIKDILFTSSEHEVKEIGAVFSGVLLWG